MQVRDAVPDDVPEILALVRELAEFERIPEAVELEGDEFAANLFGDDAVARALIAEVEPGVIAGFAVYYRTFSTWLGRSGIWLEDLYVRPQFRRAGAARAMLEALRARTDGRVEWAVLDWNTAAHHFYRKLGSEPLDEWTVWRWRHLPRA